LDWKLDEVSGEVTEEYTYNANQNRKAVYDMTPNLEGNAVRKIKTLYQYADKKGQGDGNGNVAVAAITAIRDDEGEIVACDVVANDIYGNAAIGYQTDKLTNKFNKFRTESIDGTLPLTLDNLLADSGGILYSIRESKDDFDYVPTEDDLNYFISLGCETIQQARDVYIPITIENIRADKDLKSYVKQELDISTLKDVDLINNWIAGLAAFDIDTIYEVKRDKDLY
ncbi:hypothetical protein ACFLTD_04515, partial [Elusimicrobiota bacterium]